MTALENLIYQSGLTAYKFGKKHNIGLIYRDKKKENYNLKRVLEMAKVEKVTKLEFEMFGSYFEVDV